MKTAKDYLNEAYEIIVQNQSTDHKYVDPVLIKALEDYSDAKLHQIGINLLKKSHEIYNPIRKNVVEVPDIIAAFDMAGIDIVERIDF